MTADEARQLEALARNVGELSKSIFEGAIANARAISSMEEQIKTLFCQQEQTRGEELRYRERQSRECATRHDKLEVRVEQYDNRQRGLLGFRSKVAGVGVALGVLATVTGTLASLGRVFGAW